MYTCQICHLPSAPSEPLARRTSERRLRHYTSRVDGGPGEPSRLIHSAGWEIVRELTGHRACLYPDTTAAPVPRPRARLAPSVASEDASLMIQVNRLIKAAFGKEIPQ